MIYVPEGGNLTIQQAVNNAIKGDVIIVRDGTYNENVNVDEVHLTIRSENGSANCIVHASNPGDQVFDVTEDYVNITGFTVTNATSDKAGIYLGSGVDHCNISDNNATDNYYGISLNSSSNNTLTNNTASDNDFFGIYLYSSSNNTLTNNTANSNNDYGIHLYSEQQHAHEQHRIEQRQRHLPGLFEQLQHAHEQHRIEQQPQHLAIFFEQQQRILQLGAEQHGRRILPGGGKHGQYDREQQHHRKRQVQRHERWLRVAVHE